MRTPNSDGTDDPDARYEQGEIVLDEPGGDVALRDTVVRDRIAADWLLDQPSANTVQAYRRDITEWFAWCDIWDVDVLAATSTHVRGYRRSLDTNTGRELAASTQHRKIAAVSSFYRFAVENHGHLIQNNPAANVKRPKVTSDSRTESLELHELQALIAAADASGRWEAAFVRLLFYSGARVSEICGATVADLRWERAARVLWVTRKGGKRFRMTIGRTDSPAVVALREHLADRTSGPLFPDRRGRAITRHAASYRLRLLVRAARIVDGDGRPKKLTPHGVRHTYVTLGLDAVDDIRDVQQAVGHEKLETTMIYDRSRASVDRSPTHALAAVVEPAVDDPRA